jgi:large subunit ribosomal protein L18
MKNNRLKRHKRIRKSISGTLAKPRLSVFRSSKHIQVQLINDDSNTTLLGMGTVSIKETSTKTNKAKELGKQFAQALKSKKIEAIVFDRGGYKYHGRVKAVADGLRENGIKF